MKALANMGYLNLDESERTHVYTLRENMPSNIRQNKFKILEASSLQNKVETALSLHSVHQQAGREDTHTDQISPKTGYFSPISGEWRDLDEGVCVSLDPPKFEQYESISEDGNDAIPANEKASELTDSGEEGFDWDKWLEPVEVEEGDQVE